MWLRREGTPEESQAFVRRMPSKAESRHNACIAGLSKSRRTRHEAVVYEILAGLADVIETYQFWRRTCAPQSAF